MALRDEIVPYVDENQLVAPNLVGPGTLSASDNGPMFTSELYAMLAKSGQLVSQDLADFQARIGQCINDRNMLCRVPVGQNDGQEQVDDYHGVLNGAKQIKDTSIPRKLLWGIVRNLGFMDNVNPGSKKNWGSFMPRQLQLMAMMVAAAFPSWLNPIHILIRILAFPLFLYAALIIFISCINAPPSDSDARRLSWHLVSCTTQVSFLCKLAAEFWWHRLYSVYGSKGMQGVAARYYRDNHPFIKYWVD